MKVLYYTSWTIVRLVSKIFFRIKVSGTENVPKKGGFILAANHISYVDPPLVGSWSPRQMYFFAKKELFRHKLFGEFLRRVNALPVRRGSIDRRAFEKAVNAIKTGYGLTIFPEGTRSKSNAFLDPKPGISIIARQTNCPIVPCYVDGANKLSECLRGRQRLSVSFGKPLSADWVTSFPKEKDSYLIIAQTVMKRIALLKENARNMSSLAKEIHVPTEKNKK